MEREIDPQKLTARAALIFCSSNPRILRVPGAKAGGYKLFSKMKLSEKHPATFDPEDRRKDSRVQPPPGEPIMLMFKDHSVPVLNISASGVVLENGLFKTGERHETHFKIPGNDMRITVTLEVLRKDRDNLCGCQFTNLGVAAIGAIHRYILNCRNSNASGNERDRERE